MSEQTADEAVKRGIAMFEAPPSQPIVPAPTETQEPVEEKPRSRSRGRRNKGPAPENKALDHADDTRDALD